MKETIKLGVYLFVVCAIAGILLAGTYFLTAPHIQKQKVLAEQQALIDVLPNATKFQHRDTYVIGWDLKNNLTGYVLKVKGIGYSSVIEALVGIDKEFKIVNVKILKQAETPGLGAKITYKDFLCQFIGKVTDKIFLKKDGGEIEGITAATISSQAITDAVRKRINEFKKTVH